MRRHQRRAHHRYSVAMTQSGVRTSLALVHMKTEVQPGPTVPTVRGSCSSLAALFFEFMPNFFVFLFLRVQNSCCVSFQPVAPVAPVAAAKPHAVTTGA